MEFAQDIFSPERLGLVTGSRCSPLVPKIRAKAGIDTLARTLAKEIYFQHYDESGGWQTEHGKLCEHSAFEYFNERFLPVEKGRWIKVGDCGGNTDAEGEDFGVDFKCPTSLQNWLNSLYDGVTEGEYYNQAQMYMYLTGKPKWIIASFLMETNWMSDNGLTYPVDQNKRMIINEVTANEKWVEKMLTNLPKCIKLRNYYHECLKIKFG